MAQFGRSGYQAEEGDIIKFGRVRYRLSKIVTNPVLSSQLKQDNNEVYTNMHEEAANQLPASENRSFISSVRDDFSNDQNSEDQ